MSKDIRSFFTVKSSTKKAVTSEFDKKPNNKKRTAIIIDSDSDEEDTFHNVKRNKLSSSTEKISPTVKNESPKKTSKYFQKEVGLDDMFSAKPIKRDNSRNIIKKNAKSELHKDKNLEKELLKLDDKSELLENGTNCIDTKSKEMENKTKIASKNEINSTARVSNGIVIDDDDDELERDPIQKKKPRLNSNKTSNDKIKESPKNSSKNNKSHSSPEKSHPKGLNTPKLANISKSPVKKSLSEISPVKQSSQKLCKTSTTLQCTEKDIDHNQNSNKINDFKYKEVKNSKLEVKHEPENHNRNNSIPSPATKNVENKVNLTPSDVSCSLWVDKYKPNTTKQIIGQQGDSSCVNKLTNWLKNWHKNHSGDKKLTKPSPWAKNDDGAFFKAALLSGPPGVGKTTTAHLVSKELGFDVVEFNASDTRSKKLLHQEVSELLSSNSLSPFFTGKGDQVSRKHVLLMDEVDGMAGNEDRGGVQELIQLIRQSHTPIICMCNDRNHPKIRSLANYCFDLRFSKPRVEQIKGAMLSMCFKEKLKITPNVLTDIISSANQDIRLIINHLSMLKVENSDLANSTKHIKLGPWDITRKIFSEEEHKTMSIYDKSDLFFHDYNVTPLFVHENYLIAVPHKPEAKDKIKKMELFAKAAKSLSLGDITERNIRSHNAWSLLPTQAIFSSVVPGDVLEGHLGGQINFPTWFGKNSRQSKMSRLLQELTVHSRLKISGTKESMNLDYLGALESSILTPLVKEGVEGVPKSLEVLTEYCLVREDVESLTELATWPNTTSLFSKVESKVKAAFTRAYNKTSTPTPYAAVAVKKGHGKVDNNMESIGEEEEEPEEEQDDGLEDDSMIVLKKNPTTKKAEKVVASTTSKGTKNAKRGRKK